MRNVSLETFANMAEIIGTLTIISGAIFGIRVPNQLAPLKLLARQFSSRSRSFLTDSRAANQKPNG